MASAPATREFTVSLPPDLFASAERLARRDHQTVSELLGEALRVYQLQRIKNALDEMVEEADQYNPAGYTEADIPRLIKEIRSEPPANLPDRPRR